MHAVTWRYRTRNFRTESEVWGLFSYRLSQKIPKTYRRLGSRNHHARLILSRLGRFPGEDIQLKISKGPTKISSASFNNRAVFASSSAFKALQITT